ncbi:MAG: LysE family translocator [Rhodospirillaceae bacterium]|nr:LysE family translocator [Rhodospirillaceae bacterium]
MFGLDTIVSPASTWLMGLAAFAFVSSITPGPNNILLASSGARFGAKGTVRHALGIWSGMVSMLTLAAVGVGAIVTTAPALGQALQVLAALALLATAYGMVRAPATPTASSGDEPRTAGKPWGFWQAFGFQYLNPKAMMMAFTAAAMVPASAAPLAAAAVMIGVFMTVSMPCTWVWVLSGVAMRQALNTPARQRAFNWVMAVVLVATIPLGFVPMSQVA